MVAGPSMTWALSRFRSRKRLRRLHFAALAISYVASFFFIFCRKNYPYTHRKIKKILFNGIYTFFATTCMQKIQINKELCSEPLCKYKKMVVYPLRDCILLHFSLYFLQKTTIILIGKWKNICLMASKDS